MKGKEPTLLVIDEYARFTERQKKLLDALAEPPRPLSPEAQAALAAAQAKRDRRAAKRKKDAK